DAVFIADTSTLNYAVYNKLKTRFKVQDNPSPIVIKKAIKNDIEIEGTRKACIQDGITMTRFFYWLEKM
ncbi:MAG: aminopeptidase P family protein, partial [Odoribacter sp.]|nr:aminopeptidase P family protein [Odoribacter sp.]